MLVLETPKSAGPKVDPYLEAAGVRVNAAGERLERLGIADASGRRIRTDVPPDMQDGIARDFDG